MTLVYIPVPASKKVSPLNVSVDIKTRSEPKTCSYHWADNRAPSASFACIAVKGKPGKAHIYTPVSTSLTVLSSIFLSILIQRTRRCLCVATETEQEKTVEALSSPSATPLQTHKTPCGAYR